MTKAKMRGARLCLWLGLALSAWAGFGVAQEVTVAGETYTLEDILPTDPAIRVGELENGLTYYLRPNTEPHNRAELALVINAGSVLEDDDQLGLAHFLEHMLFNGTESFPGPELINFLERTGMVFGPDVNAYTSFDETVYTLQIPLDDPEVVQTAFQVLLEWASRATLDGSEIDAERLVIVEEWRARDQNANGRIQKELLPALLGESRYASRLPIGDMEIVRNAPPEALRRFYQDWYRPELMAVVAVGDFDPEVFEGYIQETFGNLENPAAPREREVFTLPEETGERYQVISDPEFPATVGQVVFRHLSEPLVTLADFDALLSGQLFSRMVNQRLAEIARSSDPPYLGASLSRGGLARGSDTLSLSVQTEEGQLEPGLEALLQEALRLGRFGFTESELSRAKADLGSALEQNYLQRDDVDSSVWRSALVDGFLTGGVVTSNDADYELSLQLLPEITLEDVNALAADLGSDDRLVLVIAPEKEGLELPSEADLAALVERVEASALDEYQDADSDEPLLAAIPEPASIVAEESYEAIGVTGFTLQNGVRVLVKPTDFRASEVLVSASSLGGTSLVPDEDYREALIATSAVSESGAGSFDRTSLTRRLSGLRVSLGFNLGEISEGLSGSAESADLETLFQLIHLYLTKPRYDPSAFERVQDNLRSSVLNRDALPQAALQDALTRALYGDAPRYAPWTLEEVDSLDFARSFEIFVQRFGDADDFTFYVVGDVEVETVKDLAARYLGTLPTIPGRDRYRNLQPSLPTSVIKDEVFRGQEAQSVVHLRFDGPFFGQTRKDRYVLSVLEAILDIKVREDIREARGGAYSPSVFSSNQERPSSRYALGVQFTTDPARAAELSYATLGVLSALRRDGPTEDDLDKAKAQVLRSFEENLERNSYWLSVLDRYFFLSPDEDPASVLSLPEVLATITTEDVQRLAQRFIVPERRIEVILYPEGFTPTTP